MQTSAEIQPLPQQSGAMTSAVRSHQTDRFLRLAEVRFMTGLGKSSIYASIQAGRFPSPDSITDYAVAWRESEVATWIAERPKVGDLANTATTAQKSPLATLAPAIATRRPAGAKA